MDTDLIENLRKRKKLTQAEFAKMIDFTVTGYQKMIANKDIKVSSLEKICEVFSVNISTFFVKHYQQNALSLVHEEAEVYGEINYKDKYHETIIKLNACNERFIALTDIKKGSTKKH